MGPVLLFLGVVVTGLVGLTLWFGGREDDDPGPPGKD